MKVSKFKIYRFEVKPLVPLQASPALARARVRNLSKGHEKQKADKALKAKITSLAENVNTRRLR